MLHNNISNIADIFIVNFVIMDAAKICYKKYLTTSKHCNATKMLHKMLQICYIKCYKNATKIYLNFKEYRRFLCH